MPKFSDYEKFTLPLTVTLIDKTTLTLHYCPAAYNWKFRRKLQALAQQTVQATLQTEPGTEEKKGEEKPPAVTDIEFICHMLSAWDWTDDNDKMIPITPEFIEEKVNTEDQNRMAKAIWDDLFPNAEKATEDNSPSP